MTVGHNQEQNQPTPAGLRKRRDELQKRLAEAEAALPAHTIRPHQMQGVLELEEELAEVERQLEKIKDRT